MPDITMCTGEGCPHRDHCYRFTATPDEQRQSYWKLPPIEPSGWCRWFDPSAARWFGPLWRCNACGTQLWTPGRHHEEWCTVINAPM